MYVVKKKDNIVFKHTNDSHLEKNINAHIDTLKGR